MKNEFNVFENIAFKPKIKRSPKPEIKIPGCRNSKKFY
jgi:hypothetical protein